MGRTHAVILHSLLEVLKDCQGDKAIYLSRFLCLINNTLELLDLVSSDIFGTLLMKSIGNISLGFAMLGIIITVIFEII